MEKREKTISRLIKEKKESLAQKELYLRILSHDISTPLTILKTLHSDTGKSYLNNPEMARKSVSKIEKILKNCRSLEKIDLLEVHDTDKVLLNPIVLESLNQFSKEIERKQINVRIDIDKTVMTKVIGSKTTLETSLFNNLIHNAIKFSEENAEIVIRSYRSTQNAYLIIMNKSSRQASESFKVCKAI